MSESIRLILFVGMGGAIGSMARMIIHLWLENKSNASFPLATLLVNVVGSFAIGFLTGLAQDESAMTSGTRAFWMAGICGGFTTFSAFSKENLLMIQTGNYLQALFYIVLSLVVCIVMAAVGYYVGVRVS